MAVATFRFHGDLALFLARGRQERAFEHACARAATIKHAIEALGVPHTEAGRLTVNGQPATLARIVREGDAIEVFPRGAQDEQGSREFLADAHLGGLARLLRMLGFDTLYDNRFSDRDILAIVRREPRIVLTRDRELLKCREIARGCFVRAVKPEPQLVQVAARYGLERDMRPFTRCLHCNLALEAAGGHAVAQRVPQGIAERYREFSRCPGCERIYWPGSHWERMRARLAGALATPLSG